MCQELLLTNTSMLKRKHILKSWSQAITRVGLVCSKLTAENAI